MEKRVKFVRNRFIPALEIKRIIYHSRLYGASVSSSRFNSSRIGSATTTISKAAFFHLSEADIRFVLDRCPEWNSHCPFHVAPTGRAVRKFAGFRRKVYQLRFVTAVTQNSVFSPAKYVQYSLVKMSPLPSFILLANGTDGKKFLMKSLQRDAKARRQCWKNKNMSVIFSRGGRITAVITFTVTKVIVIMRRSLRYIFETAAQQRRFASGIISLLLQIIANELNRENIASR